MRHNNYNIKFIMDAQLNVNKFFEIKLDPDLKNTKKNEVWHVSRACLV